MGNTTNATATATVQTWQFSRLHTRNNVPYATYKLAGQKGVAFFNSRMLQTPTHAGVPATVQWPATITVTVVAPGNPAPANAATFLSIAACGRYNYHVPGVTGTLQVAPNWFANGAPAFLGFAGITLAQPTVTPAQVTSAQVAKANVGIAAATGTAVATPAQVAATAAKVGQGKVAAAAKVAAKVAAKGHTAKVG